MFSKTYFSNRPIWEESNTIPFNELILSWNGIRPSKSAWTFWVSLKEDEWLKYAEWSADAQTSFKSDGQFARAYQDIVTPRVGLCTHFKVKVEGEDLSGLHRLTVCLSDLTKHAMIPPSQLTPILLKDVPRQSQQVLDHPRCKDFCSPTATTTAMSYLLGHKIDPIAFAKRSHDQGFDIHGNWILNVAQCYHQSSLPCHVERLPNFAALYAQLKKGRPVVVSVKGAIPGAPKPYNVGHLMCVIGFDGQKVYCIDSGFPDNESTFIGYDLNDFLTAWGIRRNLAYVFS
jgi:hypothetical protein